MVLVVLTQNVKKLSPTKIVGVFVFNFYFFYMDVTESSLPFPRHVSIINHLQYKCRNNKLDMQEKSD
jgi:hypothetical protein